MSSQKRSDDSRLATHVERDQLQSSQEQHKQRQQLEQLRTNTSQEDFKRKVATLQPLIPMLKELRESQTTPSWALDTYLEILEGKKRVAMATLEFCEVDFNQKLLDYKLRLQKNFNTSRISSCC